MSNCLFCGIIAGTIKGEIVYQNDAVVAFNDIRPQAPVHVLIVPRKHIPSLLDLAPADGPVVESIFGAAARIARQREIADSGFRIVVNCGADAGQTVSHLHYHLLGGRRLRWPPG